MCKTSWASHQLTIERLRSTSFTYMTFNSRSSSLSRSFDTMLQYFMVTILVSSTLAQVPLLGGCPNVDIMKDFTASKYLGRWYEAERYFAFFEFGGKCVTADYTLNGNGTIKVVNSQIGSLSGINSSIEGIARAKTSDSPKLSVVFPSLPFQIEAPYWVLDTDYTSYAVVWSCNDLGVLSIRNAWILTREPNPPVAVLEKAYQVLDKNDISRAFFIRTDQKNCPRSEKAEDDLNQV